MNAILTRKILNAIKRKDVIEIRDIVHSTSIADIIQSIETYKITNILIFLRSLSTEAMADIFEKLDPDIQSQLIEKFTDENSKKLFDELFVDDIADIIEELPENLVTKILKNTSAEKRQIINKILSYDDDDTGSIMSVDITKLNWFWTVKTALSYIKKQNEDKEIVSHYYITNDDNVLMGMITIQDLAFSPKNKKLKNIMEFTPQLTTKLDKENAAIEFRKHDYSELPVVDENNKLVGIVTSDDMVDVIVEEYTEDIQKSAGIIPTNQSYLKTSVYKLSKSRFSWLFFLMFSATLSQFVLQSFIGIAGDVFGKTSNGAVSTLTSTAIITVLVSIIPDISGTSGNAGTQSSTLITRSLATGELGTKDFGRVLWKETRVGLMVGGMLGITNFIRLLIYYAISGSINGFAHDIYTRDVFISIGASIAMLTVILLSKVVGGMLPLLAVKMKMDPAIMSAPLLTTLIDSLSIAIFFSINILILFMAGFA